MRLTVAFLALVLVACGEPCPTPLVQRCGSPSSVQTCSTAPSTWFETRDCTQVLPASRRWTCCRATGAPDTQLACLPESACDPSYARRPQ